MNAYWLEKTISALQKAHAAASLAGFDGHVLSEIDHLVVTAKANRDSKSESVSATCSSDEI